MLCWVRACLSVLQLRIVLSILLLFFSQGLIEFRGTECFGHLQAEIGCCLTTIVAASQVCFRYSRKQRVTICMLLFCECILSVSVLALVVSVWIIPVFQFGCTFGCYSILTIISLVILLKYSIWLIKILSLF